MQNTQSISARVKSFAAVATSALVLSIPFSTSLAQNAAPELRWRALAGCWVPDQNAAVGATSVSGSMLCVAPVAGTTSADIATIVNKQVLHTERINASGERVNKTVDKCPGWESGTWSEDKSRLYLRSEYDCGDNLKVKGSGVLSLDADGNLVQVEGTTVGTNGGARVVRFHPADVALASGTVLTDSVMVQTVAAETSASASWFRQAAGHAPTVAAILDLSKHVDEAVAQTWIAEVGKPEKLSAKDLVAMSDAGMPPALIDMMVAMSYPTRFQVQARGVVSEEPRPTNANLNSNGNRANCYDNFNRFGRFYGSRFNQFECDRFAYRYGMYGFYSPYDFYNYYSNPYGGWYPYGLGVGGGPVVIVTRPSDSEPARPRGRAVVGGGYTRSSGTDTGSPRTTGSSSGTGSTSSGSSTGASTSAGASSGGSSSGGETRTAKPRTPPPGK